MYATGRRHGVWFAHGLLRAVCEIQSIHSELCYVCKFHQYYRERLTNLIIQVFVFKVGGAIVFSLTLWTLVDRSFVNELLGTNLFSGAVYVLLVTSVIICLVSFLGCIGAGKEVKCLLLSVSFEGMQID